MLMRGEFVVKRKPYVMNDCTRRRDMLLTEPNGFALKRIGLLILFHRGQRHED